MYLVIEATDGKRFLTRRVSVVSIQIGAEGTNVVGLVNGSTIGVSKAVAHKLMEIMTDGAGYMVRYARENE